MKVRCGELAPSFMSLMIKFSSTDRQKCDKPVFDLQMRSKCSTYDIMMIFDVQID